MDAEVGDAIVVPTGVALAGDAAERVNGGLLRARGPGIASLRHGSWTVEVRVARAAYTGLAVYRHLEEADDDV